MRANIATTLVFYLTLSALLLGGLVFPDAARSQAPGERSAVLSRACDRSCLIGFLHSYLDALVHRDVARARFAKSVRFTENDVEMPLGEGLWGSVSSIAPTGLEVADVDTGNVAWLGTVEEHGVPAYYALRLAVQDGEIVEVETVVDRKTGLPAPFGDPKQLQHDPAFAEVLPAEQRRPRERLIAVTNGYFSTVELNDGQLFTSFDPDCQRTENGISTTRPIRTPASTVGSAAAVAQAQAAGGAAAIAPGCEAQFKLGLYRINKRVRERRFPLIDEERGVVVATGFFDHANTFATYRTTDGVERKTALKWPNSITLMEAFKIRDGQIYRVEAVFTYVPYFMHSPWAGPLSAVEAPRLAALHPGACDRDCLIAAADQYMNALVAHDPTRVRWAKTVRYTENSVPMQIGDGVWGTATGKSGTPTYAADPSTGSVAWYGTVDEHGDPSYYAMRLKVEDGKTSEVEAVIRRKGDSGPFGNPTSGDPHDPAFGEILPVKERVGRRTLIKLVDGYFSTLQQNDGTIRTQFDPECARQENGMSTTNGSFATTVQGCEAQFKLGVFRFVERLRGRRFFIADEARGVVVAAGYIDHPARMESYQTTDGKTQKSPITSPSSLGLMEMFKIRSGKIYRIEAIFTSLPYYMNAPWNASH
jgi:hypothetical protein